MTGPGALLCAAAALLGAATAAAGASPPRGDAVVVASKPFTESYLLAELFAQLLEARGIAVDRRPGLGSTEVAFAALARGDVDVYPEYTGTGLLAILGERPRGDAAAVFDEVSRAFRDRWGVRWLPPLGFENTYAIAMREDRAARLGVSNLSGLARVAPALGAGLTADFIGRADGLAGLEGAYGLHFGRVRPLLPAVKYQALSAGAVDVVDGYSTDAPLARGGLVVLDDDRRFFPPYQAAALVSAPLARGRPEALAALTELSGRIDVARMRALNARVEIEGAPVAAVAADALASLGLTARAAERGTGGSGLAPGETRRAGALAWIWAERRVLGAQAARHLLLVAASLAAAIAFAVPLGLALARRGRGAEPTIRAVGLLQTIPSIALLAFMIPLLGIGLLPALVALFLYSLYPIVRNTFSGLREADRDAVAAAEALGMTPGQVLRHVQLPLAAPIVMAGIRTAAVIDVGTATLAAFIGAGGLGESIVQGLALSDTRQILAGAVPAALLALAVDFGLGRLERALTPGRSRHRHRPRRSRRLRRHRAVGLASVHDS